MFKHLLLPTDGSPLADGAAHEGLKLARAWGARVTLLHVLPPFHVMAYHVDMVEESRDSYEDFARNKGHALLQGLQRAATELGVPSDTRVVLHDHAHEAIIEVATQSGCDLIVMASHGRRGVQGLLLGSETQKVLAHGRLPVLVYR